MKAFLRYYIELPYAAGQIDQAISRLPQEWLDQAAREANLRGLFILRAGTLGQLATGRADQLSVLLSPPHAEHGLIRRSIQWIAPCGEETLAELRGDLELAELGPERTQMALNAQYRPATRALTPDERMEAQRVSESTLKAFVDRLAEYALAVLGGAAIKPPVAVVVDARQQPPMPRRLAAS